jgi:hypothetical protein
LRSHKEIIANKENRRGIKSLHISLFLCNGTEESRNILNLRRCIFRALGSINVWIHHTCKTIVKALSRYFSIIPYMQFIVIKVIDYAVSATALTLVSCKFYVVPVYTLSERRVTRRGWIGAFPVFTARLGALGDFQLGIASGQEHH